MGIAIFIFLLFTAVGCTQNKIERNNLFKQNTLSIYWEKAWPFYNEKDYSFMMERIL